MVDIWNPVLEESVLWNHRSWGMWRPSLLLLLQLEFVLRDGGVPVSGNRQYLGLELAFESLQALEEL